MDKEYNVKIELNDDLIFLVKPKDRNLEKELFDLAIEKSKVFVLNDSGENIGMKEKLKKFDISEDKVFGTLWDFEIKLLLKQFKKIN